MDQFPTILETIQSDHLWASWFSKDPSSWLPWRSFLTAVFGLSMSAEPGLLDIYRSCTGRDELPSDPREIWVCSGRRSGKSLCSALLATYLACFRSYEDVLMPGESGKIMVISVSKKQCSVILNYIKGFLSVPLLKEMIVRETTEEIGLSNGISIQVNAAKYTTTRGFTLVACLLDEIAFFASEDSTQPDREVLAAVRPALVTTNGPLIAISSPYAKRGELWATYSKHYGQPSENVLFWKAASQVMNPSLADRIIQQALADDPDTARSEWLAEFRSNISNLIDADIILACVHDYQNNDPQRNYKYYAFVDVAGGLGQDSSCLGVCHREDDVIVIDCLLEDKPPFSPEEVVADYAEMLKSYGCKSVTGDRFGSAWVYEAFQRHNISYILAEQTKSELYKNMIPALTSRKVRMPDNKRLVNQLSQLERHSTQYGRDSIDHPRGAHDDLSNVFAGCLSICKKETRYIGVPGSEHHRQWLLEKGINIFSKRRTRADVARMFPGASQIEEWRNLDW